LTSPCDLPESYLQAHQISILPTTVAHGFGVLADYRNPEATAAVPADAPGRTRLGSREQSVLGRADPRAVPEQAGHRLRLRLLPDHHQDAQPDLRQRAAGQLRDLNEYKATARGLGQQLAVLAAA
jgi:hypothetical protein